MKPFNLKEAKAGKPVCNRAGEDVRIICFDRKSDFNTPIIALHINDGAEDLFSHRIDGKYREGCLVSKFDLFMKGERRKVWANMYSEFPNSRVRCFGSLKSYETEEEAKAAIINSKNYIATVPIEWEE